jgi:hypothetical protein
MQGGRARRNNSKAEQRIAVYFFPQDSDFALNNITKFAEQEYLALAVMRCVSRSKTDDNDSD